MVQTCCVVGPSSVRVRVSPPLPGLGTELGTHLPQAEVKLRFVWAGLPLKDPCRGSVVAAPGVEDEGTHLQIKNMTILDPS